MADERRLVTVLFADVTGSTALGKSLNPEDRLTYLESIRDATQVERYLRADRDRATGKESI